MFKYQVKKNVETYMNDIIVKSKMINSHIANLAKTFQVIQKFNMCLNQTKCIFGVNLRKFLGFIVYKRGIDTNIEKV